jgi:hypothetical protein
MDMICNVLIVQINNGGRMTKTRHNIADRHRWALRLAAAALTLMVASLVPSVSVQAKDCQDYCRGYCDGTCSDQGGCKSFDLEPNGTPPYTCGCLAHCNNPV